MTNDRQLTGKLRLEQNSSWIATPRSEPYLVSRDLNQASRRLSTVIRHSNLAQQAANVGPDTG